MGKWLVVVVSLLACFTRSRQNKCYADSLRLFRSHSGKRKHGRHRQRYSTITSNLQKCSKGDPTYPAKLLAVDGGGTQVKVLLLPEGAEVENLEDLNHCFTNEEFLKAMLKSGQLLIPADGTILPVTGGLGDRLRREKAFSVIASEGAVGEFQGIAAGAFAEQKSGGLKAYSCMEGQKADVPPPLKKTENGIILVDTTSDRISFIKQHPSRKGQIEARTLTQFRIGNTMFKRVLGTMLNGSIRTGSKQAQDSRGGSKQEPSAAKVKQKQEKEMKTLQNIQQTAASNVEKRLELNAKESPLRLKLVGNEKELKELKEQAVNKSDEKETTALQKNTELRAELQKLYGELRPRVSSAHKKIEEIYPNGIGALGPLATACFMAHASNCTESGEQGLVDFATGFLEMVVVNTIHLASLWKALLKTPDSPDNVGVVYVGRFVSKNDDWGKTAEKFFNFRTGAPQRVRDETLEQILTAGGSIWFDDLSRPKSPLYMMWKAGDDACVAHKHRVSYKYDLTQSPTIAQSFSIASLGTGIPVLSVSNGDYIGAGQIGGSAVGGGTFMGLLEARYPGVNFTHAVKRAGQGGHIIDGSRMGPDAQADVTSVATNIAEFVSLLTLAKKMNTIVFVGGFMVENELAEKIIAAVCASFGVQTLFEKQTGSRHRGFVGAFGAWILSNAAASFSTPALQSD